MIRLEKILKDSPSNDICIKRIQLNKSPQSGDKTGITFFSDPNFVDLIDAHQKESARKLNHLAPLNHYLC